MANEGSFPLIQTFDGNLWQSVKGNHKTIAMTFRERAKLFISLGQYERATQEYDRAIMVFQNSKYLPTSIERLELLRTRIERFSVQYTEYDLANLIKSKEELISLLNTNLHLDVARTQFNIVIRKMKLGIYDECINDIKETLNIYRRILNSEHPDLKNAENWNSYFESFPLEEVMIK